MASYYSFNLGPKGITLLFLYFGSNQTTEKTNEISTAHYVFGLGITEHYGTFSAFRRVLFF